MSAAKQKGTAFEVLVRDYLLERGLHSAHRVLQEGWTGRADILFGPPPSLAIQCKTYKNVADGVRDGVDGAVKQAAVEGRDYGVAVVKRPGKGAAAEAYAVMRLEDYVTLILELRNERGPGRSPGVNRLGLADLRGETGTEWWHGKHGLLPAEGMGDDETGQCDPEPLAPR